MNTRALYATGFAFLSGLLLGCDAIEPADTFIPSSPHEAYAHALKQAGLAETALAREWLGAADASLRAPVHVTLPMQEAGYLPSDRPRAVAYRINLVRGRRLLLEADLTPAPGALLFIDVYAAPESPGDSLHHLIAADSGARSLAFEPRRTGDYIIRIQPELLRGGRYTLQLRAEPALAFPVQGASDAAIQSGFGAPRDGGIRDHHGIDIFAPRGTPVLAVASGVVTRVQETARGGRVVWVRDERRGNSVYYAHLDRQLVASGAQVNVGDILGLVGNTGNARGTSPHLHFGIYRRGEGPLDPRVWVVRVKTDPAPLRADLSLLGEWGRLVHATALRAAPSSDAMPMRALAVETMLLVLSARAGWYHVKLPDGLAGYIPAADAGSAQVPLRGRFVTGPTELLAQPTAYAAVIDTLPGDSVQVHGRFGDRLYVEVHSIFGWIADR